MTAKLLVFPSKERGLRGSTACPAEHYAFTGQTTNHLDQELFLEKAAAFQEIRDCLAAADKRRMSPSEAEARIAFYVRAYLYPDQDGW